MGAWGLGHFENDDATDWVWALEDTESLQPVIAAIDDVANTEGYLQAPNCTAALAAAETIAAALGKCAPNLPESVARIAAKLGPSIDPALVGRAVSAVSRIKAESELKELWQETEDFDSWKFLVDELLSRLMPGAPDAHDQGE